LGQIWKEIGLKDLVGQQSFSRTQSHFFKPGAGKWRQYLDVRHAKIAEEEGLAEQMVAFGYAFDLRQFALVSDAAPAPAFSTAEIASMQAGDWPYFLFGTPASFASDGVIQDVLPCTGMKFVTNDVGFAEALRELDGGVLPIYYASGSPLQ
jgi:hypothetical protein